MEADVTVVSDADCAAGSGLQQCTDNPDTLSYSGKITSQMLCASATGGKKKLPVLKVMQGRMLSKATAAGHSLSRPVTNTIWPGSSAGATAVLPTACRVSMLRSPSCEVGWTPLSLHKEGLGPHVMLSSILLQTSFQ